MSGVFLSVIFILFSPPDGLSFVSMLYSCVKPYQWSHFSRQIQACHGQSFGFHFKSRYFKANSLIFLRLCFSYFNPLNSHSIPFFSNLLSKDKNKVMLHCTLQDWHQFNGNPSSALKNMIQASCPDCPFCLTLSGILCLPKIKTVTFVTQFPVHGSVSAAGGHPKVMVMASRFDGW